MIFSNPVLKIGDTTLITSINISDMKTENIIDMELEENNIRLQINKLSSYSSKT